MGAVQDDLLKPSLADRAIQQPVYSVGAMIAAAFIGGVFAVPVIAIENSRRQRRLSRDAVWLVLAVVFAAAVMVGFMLTVPAEEHGIGNRTLRMVSRAGGFFLVGGFYLLHRKTFRAQSMVGIDPPKPVAIVIGSVAVGILLTIGFVVAVTPIIEQVNL